MEEIGQRLWLQIEKYDEEMESLYVEQEGLHAKIQELQKGRWNLSCFGTEL